MASKPLVYSSGSTYFCLMAVGESGCWAYLKYPPSVPKVPTPLKKLVPSLPEFSTGKTARNQRKVGGVPKVPTLIFRVHESVPKVPTLTAFLSVFDHNPPKDVVIIFHLKCQ